MVRLNDDIKKKNAYRRLNEIIAAAEGLKVDLVYPVGFKDAQRGAVASLRPLLQPLPLIYSAVYCHDISTTENASAIPITFRDGLTVQAVSFIRSSLHRASILPASKQDAIASISRVQVALHQKL